MGQKFRTAKNAISRNFINTHGKYLKKIFCEIDLFDFTSFFGLDFFKFSGPLCKYLPIRFMIFKNVRSIYISL